jgi:hypothetical protein
MDRERVDACCEFTGKCLIHHAVALKPALSAERFRHDMNAKMSLAARPMPGVALVPVGFVDHVELFRGEGRRKLLRDLCLHRHGGALKGKPVPASTISALRLAEIVSVKT